MRKSKGMPLGGGEIQVEIYRIREIPRVPWGRIPEEETVFAKVQSGERAWCISGKS